MPVTKRQAATIGIIGLVLPFVVFIHVITKLAGLPVLEPYAKVIVVAFAIELTVCLILLYLDVLPPLIISKNQSTV